VSMTARCRHAFRSSGGPIATTLVWLVSEATEKTNGPVGTFDVTSGILAQAAMARRTLSWSDGHVGTSAAPRIRAHLRPPSAAVL
jgi:hypothetical protein